MSAFVDINNPSNYKNCSKKQYEIYVCMPPKNTVVINKLEQADVIKVLGGKTYFTAEQVEKMQKSNPSMLAKLHQLVSQGRAYAVTDATPFVLCGTVGEMWTISPDKLAKTYNFLQGKQPLQINQQSLGQRMKNGLLDWTLVRTSPQATAGQNMACFVPSAQKGQIKTSWGAVLNINGAGISHGKGDFVVCAKLPNGKPNLSDRWVVNGDIFATTYNNQGWTDCLKQSDIKNITITSLPNLVPQQAVNNDKGVDANVFKQKCDTLMKELQKVYKFNIASNEYGTVDNCIGFSKSKCYTARYIVKGNFNYKYGSLDEPSSSTLIWFVCDATHSDSALGMVFERDEIVNTHCKDITTKGTVFIELPHNNTGVNTTYGYKNCRTGSISDINCAEEVQSFKLRHRGTADTFIDNRKGSSETYLDARALLYDMECSYVKGSIGVSHVLKEVYSKMTNDALKEKAYICHEEYVNLNTDFGSASIAFANIKETEVKGSMIGKGILSHKMNLKSLIKYLVSACQQEETNYYALTVLYRLSRNALTEAILELFYDTNNPNLATLWKRLDLQYMFNNKIDLSIYEHLEHDVNKDRVCIDFCLSNLECIFVRCVYTASGNYGFDFIPKKPIEEYGVGATYSFNKDYENYLGICKQLRDSCYRSLTEDASKDFRANLPKYLVNTDFEYLGLLGGKVGYLFRIISNNQDANNSDYNRETNTYKIKFAVGSNETRVIYMSEDDAHTVSVKCTLNGVTFEKSYKLSIKRSIDINAMLIFSDICKVLKIHPAKELLKSKRLWDNVTQTVSEKFSSGNHRKFDSVDVSSKIDKITPVSINLGNTKYEILLRFYNNEKVIGERVLVVDFNYKNFDMRTANSRSIKALGDLQNSDDITDMIFSMRYKYSVDTVKVTDYTSSIDISDITNEFYWATYELINSTKKYQV